MQRPSSCCLRKEMRQGLGFSWCICEKRKIIHVVCIYYSFCCMSSASIQNCHVFLGFIPTIISSITFYASIFNLSLCIYIYIYIYTHTCIYIYIYILYHHHHIVLVARISLTLSRHSSLSFIALGRSSGQHPVSSHSC